MRVQMDWFERLTGFRETAYADTHRRLKIEDGELHSLVNGRSYGIGELELVSLANLRERVKLAGGPPGHRRTTGICHFTHDGFGAAVNGFGRETSLSRVLRWKDLGHRCQRLRQFHRWHRFNLRRGSATSYH